MTAALAPSGWGFIPGANLCGPSTELPDLPLLKLIQPGRVTPTIRDALDTVPHLLPTLTARNLMDKYGIGRSLAHDILRSMRT